MSVSSFASTAAASSSIGTSINLSATNANTYYSYTGTVKAGAYSLTKTATSAVINVYFYNGQALVGSHAGNVANGTIINIPQDCTNVIYLGDTAGMTITYVYNGAFGNSTATYGAISSVTTSGSVTIASRSLVMCMGGGGSGATQYNTGVAGGSTSIGGIIANGGSGGSSTGGGQWGGAGGAGGSGGGGGAGYNAGTGGTGGGSGGSNGTNGNSGGGAGKAGAGGTGSGVATNGSQASPLGVTSGSGGSGSTTTSSATGYGGGGGSGTGNTVGGAGGGIYAGGGAGNASDSNGTASPGGGGSGYLAFGVLSAGIYAATIGSGGTLSNAGSGYQGAIWIREIN